MAERDTLLKILDLARWAPSGDNTQPWRFEIVSGRQIAVHGFDTRSHVIYDFDGHSSHMAHGALLETLRIAASVFSLEASWTLRSGCSDSAPIYDVVLNEAAGLVPDPLAGFIEQRVVQRRPMRLTSLTSLQRRALANAAGPDYEVQLFESFADRLKVARLLWRNAYLRLTCPEAYLVHRDVIEWNARYSTDRIPEQAVGVDPLTARLMHWVMQSWNRVDFFNRYLFGTIPPRIQLDLIPALACAGHVLIRSVKPLVMPDDYVRAGMALQRVWLTATASGLHVQPEMTPVIFRWYMQAGRSISAVPEINSGAASLTRYFEAVAGAEKDDEFVFFCRVGRSDKPSSRSLRKDVGEQMHG